jgi:hypothetical protein
VNTAGAASEALSGVVITVPDVHVSATGTVATLLGMKSLFTVIVAEGGAAHPAKVSGAGSVIVASVLARARPIQLPRVIETALPARTVPTKAESVNVTACAVFQYTLHACAAPPMTTCALVSVRAPNPPVPTLKTQTSVALPLSVRMTPAGIVVAAAEQ